MPIRAWANGVQAMRLFFSFFSLSLSLHRHNAIFTYSHPFFCIRAFLILVSVSYLFFFSSFFTIFVSVSDCGFRMALRMNGIFSNSNSSSSNSSRILISNTIYMYKCVKLIKSHQRTRVFRCFLFPYFLVHPYSGSQIHASRNSLRMNKSKKKESNKINAKKTIV